MGYPCFFLFLLLGFGFGKKSIFVGIEYETDSNTIFGSNVAAGLSTLYNTNSSLVYQRFYWKQLEPSEGQFNLTEIQRHINIAKDKQRMFSFGIIPLGIEPGKEIPEWARLKIGEVNGTLFTPPGLDVIWVPDNNNIEYQDLIEKVVRRVALDFGDNDWIFSVDIGMCGFSNEWNYFGMNLSIQLEYKISYENAKSQVDLFFSEFPEPIYKLIPETTGMNDSRVTDIFDYAVGLGAGIRGNFFGDTNTGSIMTEHYQKIFDRFGDRYLSAPVHFEIISSSLQAWQELQYDYATSFQSAIDWKLHNLNVKDSTIPSEMSPSFDVMLREMGYRLTIRSLEYTVSTVTSPSERQFQVQSVWSNIGVTPVYCDYRITWNLVWWDVGYTVGTFTSPQDLRNWIPSSEEDVIVSESHDFTYSHSYFDPGHVYLDVCVELELEDSSSSSSSSTVLRMELGIEQKFRTPNFCYRLCQDGWNGENCTIPTCEQRCEHDGYCIDLNTCDCVGGWGGEDCATATCNDIDCGEKGICGPNPDECTCEKGFSGESCDVCDEGYYGDECVTPTQYILTTNGIIFTSASVALAIVLVLLILLCCVFCVSCCCCVCCVACCLCCCFFCCGITVVPKGGKGGGYGTLSSSSSSSKNNKPVIRHATSWKIRPLSITNPVAVVRGLQKYKSMSDAEANKEEKRKKQIPLQKRPLTELAEPLIEAKRPFIPQKKRKPTRIAPPIPTMDEEFSDEEEEEGRPPQVDDAVEKESLLNNEGGEKPVVSVGTYYRPHKRKKMKKKDTVVERKPPPPLPGMKKTEGGTLKRGPPKRKPSSRPPPPPPQGGRPPTQATQKKNKVMIIRQPLLPKSKPRRPAPNPIQQLPGTE